MFVSVVSLLHRNSNFRCFDWTETNRRWTETNRNKKAIWKIFKPFKMSSPPPSFPYTHKTVITNREISLYRVKRGFPAAAKLLLLLLLLQYLLELRRSYMFKCFTKHMIQVYCIEDDNYQLLLQSILLPTDQNFGLIYLAEISSKSKGPKD
jgi:hypothetical protein